MPRIAAFHLPTDESRNFAGDKEKLSYKGGKELQESREGVRTSPLEWFWGEAGTKARARGDAVSENGRKGPEVLVKRTPGPWDCSEAS